MPKLSKDVLYAGTWRLNDGRLFKCAPNEIPHFAKRMQEMLDVGLNIPLTWEHQDNIYAMSQEEMQRRLADQTKATLGWGESAVADQGALQMKVNVPSTSDAEKLNTIRFVSPTIKHNYVDSKGRLWPGKSIIQLAVTPIPVQHEQRPFRGVADAPMHLSLAGWTNDEANWQVELGEYQRQMDSLKTGAFHPDPHERAKHHAGLAAHYSPAKSSDVWKSHVTGENVSPHPAGRDTEAALKATHAAHDAASHIAAAGAHIKAHQTQAIIHGGNRTVNGVFHASSASSSMDHHHMAAQAHLDAAHAIASKHNLSLGKEYEDLARQVAQVPLGTSDTTPPLGTIDTNPVLGQGDTHPVLGQGDANQPLGSQVDLAMPAPSPGPHVEPSHNSHIRHAHNAVVAANKLPGSDHPGKVASSQAHEASVLADSYEDHIGAAAKHMKAGEMHSPENPGIASHHYAAAGSHLAIAHAHAVKHNLSLGDDTVELANARLHAEGRTQVNTKVPSATAVAIPLEHHEIAKHYAGLAMTHAKTTQGPALHSSFMAHEASKKAKMPEEHLQAMHAHYAAGVAHSKAGNEEASLNHFKSAEHHRRAFEIGHAATKQAGGKQGLRMAPTPKVGQAVKLSLHGDYMDADQAARSASHWANRNSLIGNHVGAFKGVHPHHHPSNVQRHADMGNHAEAAEGHDALAGFHEKEAHEGFDKAVYARLANQHRDAAQKHRAAHAALEKYKATRLSQVDLSAKKKSKGRAKIQKVMDEFKKGKLKTSAGTKVTNPKQAVAIGYSEARRRGAKLSNADDIVELGPSVVDERGLRLTHDEVVRRHSGRVAVHHARDAVDHADNANLLAKSSGGSLRALRDSEKAEHQSRSAGDEGQHHEAAEAHMKAAERHHEVGRHHTVSGNRRAADFHYKAAVAHHRMAGEHMNMIGEGGDHLSQGATMADDKDTDDGWKDDFPSLVKVVNEEFGGNVLGDDVTEDNFAQRFIAAMRAADLCDDDEGYTPPDHGGDMPKEVQTGLLTLSEKTNQEMLSLKATAEAEKKRADAFEHRMLTQDRAAAKDRVNKLVPKVLSKKEADEFCADIDKEMVKLSLEDGHKYPCIIRLEAFEQVAARMPNDRFNLSQVTPKEIVMPKTPDEEKAEAEKNGKAEGAGLAAMVGYTRK